MFLDASFASRITFIPTCVVPFLQVGFSGGLVVDFPHSTRAKKYFLVLMVGTSTHVPQARGLNGEDSDDEERTEVKV